MLDSAPPEVEYSKRLLLFSWSAPADAPPNLLMTGVVNNMLYGLGGGRRETVGLLTPRPLKIGLMLVLMLLLPALMQGCSAREDHDPSTLVVGLTSDPQNLDPRFGLDAGSLRCFQLMYNGLFRYNEASDLEPDLAESFRVENRTDYVITLRAGARFHNGAELTAQDAQYTFESILDEKNASPLRQTYSVIERMVVEDRYRIRFVLKRPHAPFLGDLTQPVISAQSAGSPSEPPAGTGPYKFLSRKPGENIELVAHEDYFEGSPRMKRVRLIVATDDTTRFLRLKKGEIDFVQNGVAPETVPLLEKDPAFTVLRGQGSNYVYVGFNLRDPLLKNRNVRAAIAHGLNVEEMITYLAGGYAQKATGLLYPGNWAYEPDVATFDYDLAKARRLLDEAGFKGKPRFRLSYKTSQSDLGLRKAEYIQAQLKKLDIDVEIRSYEWSTFFNDIRQGNFQLYSLEWVGISDPDIYTYLFDSTSLPPNGANRGGYVNHRVDELLRQGRTALDRNERAAVYHEVQRIIARDLPYVSLWHPDNIAVLHSDLRNFRMRPSGDISSLWRVERVPAPPRSSR